MHAIVTTGSYLLRVDLETRSVTPLEGPSPSYYGVSWFPDSQDLVVANSRLDPFSFDLSDYAKTEVGDVSFGGVPGAPFLSWPHQLLCLSDGRVACTNTGRNCITVFDPARPTVFQEVRISGARWDRLPSEPEIGDHLNSVFERDGLLHVVAHRFTKGSAVAAFTLPDLELARIDSTPRRTGLHNIWLTADGQRIACHSEQGAVVDLASDAVLWESGAAIYTRGLAATADIVVVGESQIFARQSRSASHSGLWVLDRRSWKALDYISLGPYGGVNEVRILDVPDHAHHGHVFAGLDRLRKCDMRLEMTADRMKGAMTAVTARAIWKGLDQIFGLPEIGPEGERIASTENLCLAVHNNRSNQHMLSFKYTLGSASQQSHAAAVVGYRGSGGDTDMTALLLQPATGNHARLGIWHHDGTVWSCQPDIHVDELPLSGRVDLSLDNAMIALSIDGKGVVTLPAAEVDALKGPWGIRWLGCSVRPLTDEPRT